MTSIRKTKKRLKREIAEDEMILSNEDIFFTDYISQHLEQKKQQLQQLKRKKR